MLQTGQEVNPGSISLMLAGSSSHYDYADNTLQLIGPAEISF